MEYNMRHYVPISVQSPENMNRISLLTKNEPFLSTDLCDILLQQSAVLNGQTKHWLGPFAHFMAAIVPPSCQEGEGEVTLCDLELRRQQDLYVVEAEPRKN